MNKRFWNADMTRLCELTPECGVAGLGTRVQVTIYERLSWEPYEMVPKKRVLDKTYKFVLQEMETLVLGMGYIPEEIIS